MRSHPLVVVIIAAMTAVSFLPDSADAQLLKKLKKAAQNAAASETERQVDRLVRNAIRCAVDDPVCYQEAQASGEEVIFVDDTGEIIADEEGSPITDREEAVNAAPRPEKPGQGAWANYDFVPGENILFYEDFAMDNVGDFPRRMTFVRGNWEIIDWQGRRLLRNTGPRYAAVQIPLPDTLPERFTIELEAYFPHTNQQLIVAATAPEQTDTWSALKGNVFQVGVAHGTGVTSRSRGAVRALNRTEEVSERLAAIRIMVDRQYAKVFVGERRVANVPNAEILRSNRIHLENTYFADDENPMLLGTIRVAAGGRDLYDVLEAEGRVATHGILFATGSARIRPESTPTLKEIGTMLAQHVELRIGIEGHTDDVGDDASNQTLSEERAASVKAYLVETLGIDADRLETAGYGETKPVVPNDSPEARQQNRRVELVRK